MGLRAYTYDENNDAYDAWHGSYSAFKAFRRAIATVANWPMRDDGACLPNGVPAELLEPALHGYWPETPTDPLAVLLLHADNEGRIMHEQCGPLRQRLLGLHEALRTHQDRVGPPWLIGTLEQFCHALDIAAMSDTERDVYFH